MAKAVLDELKIVDYSPDDLEILFKNSHADKKFREQNLLPENEPYFYRDHFKALPDQ